MTAHFFAYGTLMCEEIMLAVTGRRFAGVKASHNRFEDLMSAFRG